MQLNRTQAKICFKSDSNRLLINFFDPKLSPDLIKIIVTIRIWTRICSKKSIYIQNSSNLIKNGSNLIENVKNQVVFDHFRLKSTFSIK